MDFPAPLLAPLSALAQSAGAARVVLFGSRARGDNLPRSDIDLAVYGLTQSGAAAFRVGLADLPTLLKFDFVAVSGETSPELLAEIRKDGVTLYDAETG